jgi:cobalt/nickel transport system ATP-binding protein
MDVSTPVFELRGVRHRYPDGTLALDGIDLTVEEGETVALLGPNGAGKSTLLLHLNGVLRASEGTVRVEGMEIGDETVRSVRARVGMVFQDPDDQLFMTTLYDDVAFGPLNMGLPRDEVDERVHRALHAVGLAEAASRPAQHLSFGQRKRAALATVLSMEPPVLVLDEPTSNLDPRARRELASLLRSLTATKLLATHDMGLAASLCARGVVVDAGRVATDRAMGDLMADAALLDEHGLEGPTATIGA